MILGANVSGANVLGKKRNVRGIFIKPVLYLHGKIKNYFLRGNIKKI